MRTDVHAHTTFSDGSELSAMVDAAEGAGLDALGLTDHCIVTEDAFGRRARFALVGTYERRRTAIGACSRHLSSSSTRRTNCLCKYVCANASPFDDPH